jgi:hypothetical protein
LNIPTLNEFLKDELLDRSWVQEPGFSALYVRKGRKYILTEYAAKLRRKGEFYENVLQIANCTAERSEEGTFAALIAKLELEWDGPIFIENILSERFAAGLLKLGFYPVNRDSGFHFVKKLPGKVDGRI